MGKVNLYSDPPAFFLFGRISCLNGNNFGDELMDLLPQRFKSVKSTFITGMSEQTRILLYLEVKAT